ncbi:hypothetical protein HSB1_24910 [Halogranum salarium B-1]|uniref:Uncharacterized protein n=1 Tax=Halogranum salarium B-1 TaxID=1210908 RepID=J2ZEG9_9EURY|nr:hypothetical protein HSB1_24910 [Halogranum salarium B-1]
MLRRFTDEPHKPHDSRFRFTQSGFRIYHELAVRYRQLQFRSV